MNWKAIMGPDCDKGFLSLIKKVIGIQRYASGIGTPFKMILIARLFTT